MLDGGRQERRRTLAVAVLASAVLVGAGFAAGLVVKSPQQRAAEAKAPPAGAVTAPVERRVLKSTVVVRGRVVAAQVLEVTAAPGTARPVLTGVRTRVGELVRPGQVLLEVAGRPLLPLPGSVPAYRDLRPGAEGKDVEQLQAALRQLGFATGGRSGFAGDRAGFFGEATKAAVGKLYASIGFSAPTTGDADARAVAEAAAAVSQAERRLADAREDLAAARASGDPAVPRAAERAVSFAQQDLDRARAHHAELRRTTGTMLPLAEYVFVAAFPARVDRISGTVGSVVVAPLLTLSSGELVVQSSLSPADGRLVRPELAVTISSEVHGVSAEGQVSSLGELQIDEANRSAHPLLVTATSPLEPRLVGQDVRLTIQTASSDGEVLVVPLAAVSTGADGRSTVTLVRPDRREVQVEVVAGLSGGGFVEVRPVGQQLAAGDPVVVGR